MQEQDLKYAGFWVRSLASIVDVILISLIILPLLIGIYGADYLDPNRGIFDVAGPLDFLISWVLPPVAIIVFWVYKAATPGKMLMSAKIVDAKTGEKATNGQLIGRYFAYFISTMFFGLGFIWIAFDKRKQGWHDKLAGTVVVRKKTETT